MKPPHEIARETAEKMALDLNGSHLFAHKYEGYILSALTAATQEQAKDKERLDWLEKQHAESNGEFYEIENSITYRGNTGAQELFPAMRQAIDAARGQESKV